ncbi:MAG: galactokinase [Clostridia bacterium]|nr:galactokinase [Clostridia bacterium]
MNKQPVEKKILEVRKTFKERFGDTDGLRFFAAPGRVNLIGEHIDYCGGLVFPAALTLDTVVAIRKNGTPSMVRLAATTIDGIRTFDVKDIEAARSLDWGNYQAGVVRELLALGIEVGGFDACYLSSVPFGAGLSSSASIEVSTGLAVSKLFGGKLSGVELALAGQRAENTFCGVNCGIMDQFASAMGKKDHAILLNCGTLEYKYVPLDLGDNVLILANTCKKHALGASKYNERRREVAEGLAEMQRIERSRGISEPHKTLCEYSVAELREYMCEISDPTVMQRVIHVVTENARVKDAVNVLEAGKLDEFGELLRKANNSIRYLYEATGSELDAMFDAAVSFDGCVGARMTGGGFGGCTVNIVNASRVAEFEEYVGTRYTAATGNVPEFYVCETGDGARELLI